MKKAEEIIDDIQMPHSMGPYEYLDLKDCIKAMQIYAEQEIKKHLAIASEKALVSDSGPSHKVIKESITSIKIELT